VLVNLRGVKAAGVFAQVTTYSKLIPFAAIAIIGLLFVDTANLTPFNPSGEPVMTAFAALAPLTMFAYLGLESATVPAGDVRDPERTIPRSTLLGISTAAILYVLGTVAVLGVVPREQLMTSVAPFNDAARMIFGPWAAGVVAVGVILSSIGALNGWTLLMGQVPMAAAHDGLFPAAFGRRSSRGVPATGIVISAGIATAMVLIEASGAENVRAFYDLFVGLSTMTAVIPYAFCALAVPLVIQRTKGGSLPRVTVVQLIGFAFALFTLYGCGAQTVLYGLMMLMLGIPVYVWQRRRAGLPQDARRSDATR
jgi:amino acid transporter